MIVLLIVPLQDYLSVAIQMILFVPSLALDMSSLTLVVPFSGFLSFDTLLPCPPKRLNIEITGAQCFHLLYCWFHKHVVSGILCIIKVETNDNLVDNFVKGLVT